MTREQLDLLVKYINAKVAYSDERTPLRVKAKLADDIVDALAKLEATCE